MAPQRSSEGRLGSQRSAFDCMGKALSLSFIYQDLPGFPMALRVSGRLTVLPTS